MVKGENWFSTSLLWLLHMHFGIYVSAYVPPIHKLIKVNKEYPLELHAVPASGLESLQWVRVPFFPTLFYKCSPVFQMLLLKYLYFMVISVLTMCIFLYTYVLYMYVYTHICMYCMNAWCSQRSEHIRSCGVRVMWWLCTTTWVLGTDPRYQKEQQKLLTTEPCLQPLKQSWTLHAMCSLFLWSWWSLGPCSWWVSALPLNYTPVL